MILVDTRERKNDHVERFFMLSRIPFDRTKLYVGDYMEIGGTVTIDRKQNLNELAMCLLGSSRRRFIDETMRAKRAGLELIILVEHGEGIKSINDVGAWVNPILDKHPNAVTGRSLMDAIYKFHIGYGVNIFFCDKTETGAKIIELLKGTQTT